MTIGHNYFNVLFWDQTQGGYDDNGQVVVHKMVEQVHTKMGTVDMVFDSFAHLRSSLDYLGNAFNLLNGAHKNNAAIKTKALDIYTQLLEAALDPQDGNKLWCIQEEDRQTLMRQIFQHLSQSFRQLTQPSGKGDEQLLLRDIINLYRQYSCNKTHFRRLSQRTWEFLLQVVMGIFDFLVGQSRPQGSRTSVLDVLLECTHLTLFSCFLHSGLKNKKLWLLFSERAYQQCSNTDFMIKWQNMVVGLTRKVVQIQYGLPFYDMHADQEEHLSTEQLQAARHWLVVKYGRSSCQPLLSRNQSRTKKLERVSMVEHLSTISDEYAQFLWVQFIHLFEVSRAEDNMNKYACQEFKGCFIQTLAIIVDILLAVGHPTKMEECQVGRDVFLQAQQPLDFIDQQGYSPTVDRTLALHDNQLFLFNEKRVAECKDVLSLLGKWLFYFGTKQGGNQEERNQQIQALRTIAKVFRKSCVPINEDSLLVLYQVILNHLSQKHTFDYAVLKICSQLMKKQLPGVDVLLQEYLKKIKQSFQNECNTTYKTDKQEIIKCFSNTLLFMSVRLSLVKYPVVPRIEEERQLFQDGLEVYRQYLEFNKCPDEALKKLIIVVTACSAMNGTLNYHLERLFKMAMKYLRNNPTKGLSVVETLVQSLLSAAELIMLQRIKHYSRTDCSSGDQHDRHIKQVLDIMLPHLDELNQEIGLTQTKSRQDSQPNSNAQKVRVLCLEMQLLYMWCMVFSRESQLVKCVDTDMQRQVGSMHRLFYNLTTLHKQFQAKGQDRDSNLLYKSLLNNIGKYFLFSNTLFMQTSVVETEQARPQQISLTVSVDQDTLLTFFCKGGPSLNEDLVITVRNYQGKFLWKGQLVYRLTHGELLANQTPPLVLPEKLGLNSTQDIMKEFEEEQPFLEEESQDPFSQTLRLNHAPRHDTAMEPTQDQVSQRRLSEAQPEQKQLINAAKLFLSHFGYLDLENSHNIEYLQNSPDLHRQLGELDSLPERTQVKVGCYFLVDLYSSDPAQAFMPFHLCPSAAQLPYLQAYRQFIAQLGLPLNNSSLQTGMFNSLSAFFDKEPSGQLFYSSNVFFETLFLPAWDLSLLQQAQIHILWNAHCQDHMTSKLPNILATFAKQGKLNKKHYYIVVTPDPRFQTYKVKVLTVAKDNYQAIPFNIGPLVSDMLLDLPTLLVYTQATIYNIQRSVSPQAFLHPPDLRQKKIQELTRKARPTNYYKDHVLQVFDTVQTQSAG